MAAPLDHNDALFTHSAAGALPLNNSNGGISWSGGPAWGGPQRSWMKLPQKTTMILITLLCAVVAVVGAIFFFSTKSMLQTSEAAQVSSFAYGLAATLGDM